MLYLIPASGGWEVVGTQASRNASGVIPHLKDERLTMKHEFGCVAVYCKPEVTFDHFATTIFQRRLPDGRLEDIWGAARTSASLICKRSDVRALFAALKSIKSGEELPMYPPFLALSKIILMHETNSKSGHPAPPDPFVTKKVVKSKTSWEKTTAAQQYIPPSLAPFELVDTHHKPLPGLHVQEK